MYKGSSLEVTKRERTGVSWDGAPGTQLADAHSSPCSGSTVWCIILVGRTGESLLCYCPDLEQSGPV